MPAEHQEVEIELARSPAAADLPAERALHAPSGRSGAPRPRSPDPVRPGRPGRRPHCGTPAGRGPRPAPSRTAATRRAGVLPGARPGRARRPPASRRRRRRSPRDRCTPAPASCPPSGARPPSNPVAVARLARWAPSTSSSSTRCPRREPVRSSGRWPTHGAASPRTIGSGSGEPGRRRSGSWPAIPTIDRSGRASDALVDDRAAGPRPDPPGIRVPSRWRRPSDRRAFVARGERRRPPGAGQQPLLGGRRGAVRLGAAGLADLPADFPADNALPRWLAEVGGVAVADLRARWRLAIDLDSPLDVILVAGARRRSGAGPVAALPRTAVMPAALQPAADRIHGRFDSIRRVLEDPRAELVVAGRTSAATVGWLERNARCRVRALVEERGLRASSPLAQAPLAASRLASAQDRRSAAPGRSSGMVLDRDGPERARSPAGRARRRGARRQPRPAGRSAPGRTRRRGRLPVRASRRTCSTRRPWTTRGWRP